MTLKAAADVAGRYRLERRIGRGGMAEVWLASDQRLGRPVALKFLDASFTDGRDYERETGILAGLRHPNIVTVYDAGEEDERRFIVMEWVEGESLRERLQTGGALPLWEAAAIGAAVASALAYAHERGIVHNDVKPENILLEPGGPPRLTDFGVARVTGATIAPEEAAELLGTIAYVAPEVLQGAPAVPASDVYALATTLFEALAGRLPFEAASNTALAGQKLSASPKPLKELVPDLPDELAAAISSSLAFSPADRPGATELAGMLRAVPLAESRDTAPLMVAAVARPTTPIRRAPGATRQQRAPKALLLAAVLGGAGLIVAGALTLNDSGDGGGLKPPGTATTDAQLAAASRTVTVTPARTEPPQRVVPPVISDDDDDDDDKDKEREKPGRGRGR